MTIYKILIVILLPLLVILSSCKKESSSPVDQNIDNTKGSVKAIVLLNPISRTIWPVTLKLLKSRSTTFDTVQVLSTELNGECNFSNVSAGNYKIIALPNQYFGATSYSEDFSISSKNPIDTLHIIHKPFHFLFPDTIEVFKNYNLLIDTTVHFAIWNYGTRDTLICNFDSSLVPNWCSVKIKTNIFPPQQYPTTINTIITYKSEAYKNNLLPKIIKVPFKTQYEQDTLYVNILPM